jgi:hypothetical protein
VRNMLAISDSVTMQFIRDFFRLLVYYAALGGLKPTFRDYILVPSLRIKCSFSLEDRTNM